MTNLLASIVVTVLTNVSETVPHRMVQDPSPTDGMSTLAVYRAHAVPDADPKEKWITTTISEVTEIRFEFSGNPYLARSEKPLTNWTEHFFVIPPGPKQWAKDTNNAPIPFSWNGWIGRSPPYTR